MSSRPDLRRALPATLEAVAEAGVIFVILHDVAINEGRVTSGPLASYPVFLAIFAAGVALATAFRTSFLTKVAIPVVAVGLGLVQGSAWGLGGLGAIGTVEVLLLLVALRVASLAVRDWREPVGESFALATTVLFGEVAFVGSANPVGRLLPVITVVFFAAALGSRAASVWLANQRGRPGVAASGPRAHPQRSAVVLLGTLAAFLAIGAVLGFQGGPVEVSGAFLYRWLALGLAFAAGLLAAVLLPVLSWFFGLLDLSIPTRQVEAAIERIKPAVSPTGGGGSPIERIIGTVLVVLILLLLLRAILRKWQLLQPDEPGPESDPEPHTDHVPRRRRVARTPRVRRELPADTVRRWYAEALLALEGLGLPKPRSRTPGEYLPQVVGAFPESARGFTALTRAYEHVRYGAATLERDAVWQLEVERDRAMQALANARRIDDPDQA